jgi:hypothetical protein
MRVGCIVLVNISSEYYLGFEKFIKPILDLWGAIYTIKEYPNEFDLIEFEKYSLVIIGHRKVGLSDDDMCQLYRMLAIGRIGFLNFDDEILKQKIGFSEEEKIIEKIIVNNDDHYITRNHHIGEEFKLNSFPHQTKKLKIISFNVQKFEALLLADNYPLLIVKNDIIKEAHWINYEWLSNFTLGPLSGLDDTLYKSIIWCSKKPFVLKSIPNYATIRIDDCVGDSGHYEDLPFGWVKIFNKYNFKPWLGIFFENLSRQSLSMLKDIQFKKEASISIHGEELYGLYFRNKETDTKDKIKKKILSFSAENNINLSSYVIPHAYDITSDSILALAEIGISNVGIAYLPNTGGGVFENNNKWIMGLPFRNYEDGSDHIPWDGSMSHQSIFYSDFININEKTSVFNCLSEIRDINGYEWFNYSQEPSEILDVEKAIQIGSKILYRCFQSRILGNLFTHEDSWRGKFLALIPPEKLEDIVAGIYLNIIRFNPRFDFIENAINVIKQLKICEINSIEYDDKLANYIISKKSNHLPVLQVFHEYRINSEIVIEKEIELEDNDNIEKLLFHYVPQWPNEESFFENEFFLRKLKNEFLFYGFEFQIHCDGFLCGFKVYNENCTRKKCELLLFDLNYENKKTILEISKCANSNTSMGWLSYQIQPVFLEKGKYCILIKGYDENIPYIPSGLSIPISKIFITAKENSAVIYDPKTNTITKNNNNYLRDIIFKPKADERISK